MRVQNPLFSTNVHSYTCRSISAPNLFMLARVYLEARKKSSDFSVHVLRRAGKIGAIKNPWLEVACP